MANWQVWPFFKVGLGFTSLLPIAVWNYLADMKVGDIVITENEVADGQIKIISSQVSACFSPYCSFIASGPPLATTSVDLSRTLLVYAWFTGATTGHVSEEGWRKRF